MKDCPFCNFEKIKNDLVLYQNNNFFIKVPYGLITVGHVMMVPFADVRTFAELNEDLLFEAEELKRKMCREVARNFFEPFVLEYGARLQSVLHAHFHFVPKKGRGYEISDLEKEFIKSSGLPYEIADENRVREVYRTEGEYIRFEDGGKKYLFCTKNIKDVDVIDYRVFFSQKKNVLGVLDWRQLTVDEKKEDQKRREETAKSLRIF